MAQDDLDTPLGIAVAEVASSSAEGQQATGTSSAFVVGAQGLHRLCPKSSISKFVALRLVYGSGPPKGSS